MFTPCQMLIPDPDFPFAGQGCRNAATVRIVDDIGEKLNVCSNCRADLGSDVTDVGDPVPTR